MATALERFDALVAARLGFSVLTAPAPDAWPPGADPHPSVRALYDAHDFAPTGPVLHLPFGQLALLPKARAIALWEELKSCADDDEDVQRFFEETGEDGRVRAIVHDPRRFPLAYDEAAQAFVFSDRIPGPEGRDGQLIANPAEATLEVLAPGPEALFAALADLVEADEVRFAAVPQEYGEGYWLTARDGARVVREVIATRASASSEG
jgi:cell wall assembly regulator SMI1